MTPIIELTEYAVKRILLTSYNEKLTNPKTVDKYTLVPYIDESGVNCYRLSVVA
jgi:hypothetical protein